MYEGFWENDKKNGKGRLIKVGFLSLIYLKTDGEIYQGKIYGFYLLKLWEIKINCLIYALLKGEWVNDNKEGYGKQGSKDFFKQGHWENGKLEGKGLEMWVKILTNN